MAYTDIVYRVLLLMGDTPRYRNWSVTETLDMIVSPILLGQYVVSYNDAGVLVGFGAWASVSDEILGRYKEAGLLKIKDFTSGDNLVLTDIMAPFGHAKDITKQIRSVLRDKGFKNQDIWYVRRYVTGNKVQRSML
jgi:hemolysin-activating ACP:hemolysin acyltransferase